MKALVVSLAVAFACAGPALADTETAAIQKAASRHAASEKWSVTCTPGGASLTCAFYDPSEAGSTVVDGKSVEGDGHVLFQRAKTHLCQFDVLSMPTGDSTYELEGRVNVCQAGWQEEVWPDGK